MKQLMIVGMICGGILVVVACSSIYAKEVEQAEEVSSSSSREELNTSSFREIVKKKAQLTYPLTKMSSEELSELFDYARPEAMIESTESMDPSRKMVLTQGKVFQQGEADFYESENASTYVTINAETDDNGISIQEFKDLIVSHWDELEKLHESHHSN